MQRRVRVIATTTIVLALLVLATEVTVFMLWANGVIYTGPVLTVVNDSNHIVRLTCNRDYTIPVGGRAAVRLDGSTWDEEVENGVVCTVNGSLTESNAGLICLSGLPGGETVSLTTFLGYECP